MIQIFSDTKALCKEVTARLQELTAGAELVNVALSGGNTPKALFDYWANEGRGLLAWEKVAFFWGDERCVPPDDEMSNYGMTYVHLFAKVPEITKEQIHRIDGEADPESEAVRYGTLLEEMLPLRNGYPCFDLILLGLGDDGHTASIFPNQIEKWDATSNCVVAEHPQSNQKRISLTGQVINNADEVIFMVTGSGKATIVQHLIEGDEAIKKQYPAANVKLASGTLYWYLDKEAAAQLQERRD